MFVYCSLQSNFCETSPNASFSTIFLSSDISSNHSPPPEYKYTWWMTKSFVSCYKSGDPSNTQPNISAPILASGILQLGRRVCGSGCYVIVDIISHSRPKLCISNLIWEGSQLAFVVRAPYISIHWFLDALASLGSVLESEWVTNVFEILSNLGHIFRLSSGYAQGRFKYVQSVFR